MTTNALATPEQLAIEDVKRLANIVLGLRSDVFKPEVDYGVIPGTNTKPVLLLPGMEKLLRALHLRPEYVERSKIEDFDKNIIYYRYECRIIDYETGLCVATAIGSANSHESKWRWREQKRSCPVCGKETINKSKDKPEWYCWKKIGGCGATFPEADKRIIDQAVGRIENPDIFDQMNTIDKIAQKRALGSAIKSAANVSEFFTVDLEKFEQYETSNVIEGQFTVVEPAVTPEQPSASVSGAGIPKQETPKHWNDDQEAWNSFLTSAQEKLSLGSKSVREALDTFEELGIADWQTSKGWALAACVAFAKDFDVVVISAWTSAQSGDTWLEIDSRARQIAQAVERQNADVSFAQI